MRATKRTQLNCNEVLLIDPSADRAKGVADCVSGDHFRVGIILGNESLASQLHSADLLLIYDHDTLIPDVVRKMVDASHLVPFCGLSEQVEVSRIVASVRHGAVDYFHLPLDGTFLERALMACGEGRKVLRQEVDLKDFAERVAQLSKREVEIAKAVSDGTMVKELVDDLGISEKTVGVHLHNIYKKLSISSKYELIKMRNIFY